MRAVSGVILIVLLGGGPVWGQADEENEAAVPSKPRDASVDEALSRLAALGRLGASQSHAPEVRDVADRIARDAELMLDNLGGEATVAPAEEPSFLELRALDPRAFNAVILAELHAQIEEALAAVARAEDQAAGQAEEQALRTTARELVWNRHLVSTLMALYGPAPAR